MNVPILLVTGFLGAGKTSLINRLLAADHGRRIGAIVNDFGSINIDADILSGTAEGVIGLKNGCICCTLQGDLLRTLKLLLNQKPGPDLIVIEASGVADPVGIVQSLMDPVIWFQASLGNIVCVVDGPDSTKRWDDPLFQAQLRASDMVCLSKTDSMSSKDRNAVRTRLGMSGRHHFFDLASDLPLTVLISEGPETDRQRYSAGQVPLRDDRFVHLEWTCEASIDMQAFQDMISRLSPYLLRAKGFLSFRGRNDSMLFQLAGQRATLARANDPRRSGCALVLIGERGALDIDAVRIELERLKEQAAKA
jgi:G3E family GTPase